MSKLATCKHRLLLRSQHLPWLPATSQACFYSRFDSKQSSGHNHVKTHDIRDAKNKFDPPNVRTNVISDTHKYKPKLPRDPNLAYNNQKFIQQGRRKDKADPTSYRFVDENKVKTLEDVLVPVMIEPLKLEDGSYEFEGVENVDQNTILEVLNKFKRKEIIRELAREQEITDGLFNIVIEGFRTYCIKSKPLDPELKVLFHDIVKQGHSVDQLFVYFLTHARKMYPHLECMKELRSISDLTKPHNWYPLARTIQRRVIFHAGPTNSGKTYEALQAFKNANSGAFCGPLRLLAAEVFRRMNDEGVPCDLVTGDDRQYAIDRMNPVPHLACTVEMLSTEMRVDTVVIDEIQMLRDPQRGNSWTRALLGAAADEIHLCGEKAAVPIVKKLLDPIGEHVEVHEYERKSDLVVSTHSLRQLKDVRPGDCIVAFSKKTIFDILRQLERLGIKTAVIYGDLPAATKRIQTDKFNDPNDETKVLVATDAIGMGLNLNINRVIFERLTKPPYGDLIPAPHIKQIGGRAGRFASSYTQGEVTTLHDDDLLVLRSKMKEPIPDISQVGISPGFEQVELFSHHLPKATFINILEIFQSIAKISGDFFLSEGFNNMMAIAKLLINFDLPLKTRWTFCLVPLNINKSAEKADLLTKIVKRYCEGNPINVAFVKEMVGWPRKPGRTLKELTELEDIFEFLDVYLWLSYRFPDMFIEPEAIRLMQEKLNRLILQTIKNVVNTKEDTEEDLDDDMIVGSMDGEVEEKDETEIVIEEEEEGLELVEEYEKNVQNEPGEGNEPDFDSMDPKPSKSSEDRQENLEEKKASPEDKSIDREVEEKPSCL